MAIWIYIYFEKLTNKIFVYSKLAQNMIKS